MLRSFIFICSGAGLLACSSVTVEYAGAARLDVNAQTEQAAQIDSIIAPYRKELNAEMMEVIAHAPKDFTRDRPNGSLNNWSCDALLSVFEDKLRQSGFPTIALLNHGGLRNPISQGEVTLGDLFKLMPFDNEVVIVRLPLSVLDELKSYLETSGGEALAGAKLIEGVWSLDIPDGTEQFQIVTSDYLMNGGDHMDFFQKKLKVEYTGVLLRDAFIQFARTQQNLQWSDEERFRK
jgi:2',3'-cyclic-nucleotide 2'-phosphodiesterase (5'-nucleotidase family)